MGEGHLYSCFEVVAVVCFVYQSFAARVSLVGQVDSELGNKTLTSHDKQDNLNATDCHTSNTGPYLAAPRGQSKVLHCVQSLDYVGCPELALWAPGQLRTPFAADTPQITFSVKYPCVVRSLNITAHIATFAAAAATPPCPSFCVAGLNKYSSHITQPKSQGASQAMLYATGEQQQQQYELRKQGTHGSNSNVLRCGLHRNSVGQDNSLLQGVGNVNSSSVQQQLEAVGGLH